ncbi:hypothetical protein ABIF68_004365 [Bradyrhizobium japonicum]
MRPCARRARPWLGGRGVGARHPERQIEHLERATLVLDGRERLPVRELRIGQRLGHGAIGRGRHTGRAKRDKTRVGRERPRPGLDAVHHVGPVLAARGVGGEARIGNPFGAADHAHQALERLLARDRDHDIAIGRLGRPEHRARRWLHRELRALQLDHRQGQHRFQHGDVDVLALPGHRALIERRRNRAETVGAGDDIGMVDAAIIGTAAAGLIGEMRHVVAGGRMDHRRVGRQLRRGTGLAVARDRAIDQLWIDRAQAVVVEPQPVHHAGAKVLDQDIGGRGEPAHRLLALLGLEIEHDAFLADVELAEYGAAPLAQRRPGAHRLAAAGLDLDDLGAHVGKHPRTMGTGDGGRKIQDPEAREGLCRRPLMLIC